MERLHHSGVARASGICGIAAFVCLGIGISTGKIWSEMGVSTEVFASLFSLFVVLELLLSVSAVILGSVGLNEARHDANLRKWQAWTGLILGLILLIVFASLFWMVLTIPPDHPPLGR